MTNRSHSNRSSLYADAEDDALESSSSGDAVSKRQKVRNLASRAKSKIKELPELMITKVEGDPLTDHQNDGNLSDDPAFNPGLILDGGPPKRPSPSSEGKGQMLKQAGNAIIHPRRAIREKTTRMTATKMSQSQRPYLSPEQDLELLKADDDLAKVASSTSSVHNGATVADDSDEEAGRVRLRNVQDNRESLKTAWAIGRHVFRVQAVQKPASKPKRQAFKTKPAQGPQRLEWEKYLGHLLLWYTRGFTPQYIDDFGDGIPFDVQELVRIVERLAMVSEPWQTFFIEVRSIYMWKDMKRTSKWCALFWILWYTEHLVGYIYAHIIFITLYNRIYPTSVRSVRKTMARGIDRQAKAQAWGELIEKHGQSDWVEPLIRELGPLIQMQLGDFTDFIEVLVNFYRWERPSKTAATLFFYFSCLLITLVADMRFCVQLVWLIFGGGFFFCWPLATRFPQYRKLTDSVRWVYWDIPTHAELGITQLQEKALLKDAEDLDQRMPIDYDFSHGNESGSDYFSADDDLPMSKSAREMTIRAYHGKTRGSLTLGRKHLTFSSQFQAKVTMSLSNITEMRKVPIEGKAVRLLSFQSHTEGLELDFRPHPGFKTETLSIIVNRTNQNRIFNHILAWSGLKWQSLALKRHLDGPEGRKEIDKAVEKIVHGKDKV
jgi:hypothetical protein